MTDCLFCKMIEGEITANVVYENDDVFAFRDINPQAPSHILVVPRQHIASINELEPKHVTVVGQLYLAAQMIARQEGFAGDGYRTVMNCGEKAGQTVFHLHLHILAGRAMHWPPG